MAACVRTSAFVQVYPGPEDEPAPDEDQPPFVAVGCAGGVRDRCRQPAARAVLLEGRLEAVRIEQSKHSPGEERDGKEPEEHPVGDSACEHHRCGPPVAIGHPEADVDRRMVVLAPVGPFGRLRRPRLRPVRGAADTARSFRFGFAVQGHEMTLERVLRLSSGRGLVHPG